MLPRCGFGFVPRRQLPQRRIGRPAGPLGVPMTLLPITRGQRRRKGKVWRDDT